MVKSNSNFDEWQKFYKLVINWLSIKYYSKLKLYKNGIISCNLSWRKAGNLVTQNLPHEKGKKYLLSGR